MRLLPQFLLLSFAACFSPAIAGAPYLNEAPPPPPPSEKRVARAEVTANAVDSTPTGFVIEPASREASRIFYRTVFASSENVPIGWTGDVDSGNAGTTSAAFRQAVQRRVNYFRAMAGVPAGITFDNTYNAKDQKAALMMSANNGLSHFPPTGWKWYSADGAEAAGKSNIFLGYHGPAAIRGYIEDYGSPNASAGHRRWILYPQTKTMGTGDIPPNGDYNPANALWVVTPDFGTTRPAVRDTFVAWPPPGFVPYTLVFPRWSFSYPGADFTNTTVTMKRGTTNVPVKIESHGGGEGEETIVWTWNNLDANEEILHFTAPASDTAVQVSVNGVVIGGQARNFSYTVTLFDPQKPGADTVLANVSGPAQPKVGASHSYTCNTVPSANACQFRTAALGALTAIEGAENGTANVAVDAPAGSNLVSSSYHASGAKSFHFATPDFVQEAIVLQRTVLASVSAQLTFKSRFGYATPQQVAHVQVSTDEGGSWDTLFTAAGDNSPDSTFSAKTVSLAGYANRTLAVRFLFAFEDGGDGTAYTQTDENIGWYVDDIAFTNARELTDIALKAVGAGTSTTFTPAAVGDYAVQARAQFFGDYLFEWGLALAVTATNQSGLPQIDSQPVSRTVAAGGAAQFSVTASGPGTLTYQWFHGTQAVPNATAATLTLDDVQPADAGDYLVKVTNISGTTPSNSATLTVTVPNPVTATAAGSALSETSVKLKGHVEVNGQTVACGFEWGPDANFGSTASAGSASTPRDFEATLTSLPAGSTVFYRAFAEVSGGTRFYGARLSIKTLAPAATLTVSVNPQNGGSVSGIPVDTVHVGDSVTLTAQPANGFAFTGWTGDRTTTAATLTFTMPASLGVTANFSSSPILKAAGRYRGLALTSPVSFETCGLVTVTVAAKGLFTGQVTIAGLKFAVRGVFDESGVAHFGTSTEATLPRAGQAPLLLRLHLPTGSATPMRLLGDVRETGGFTAGIDAPRAVFTAAKTPVAPLVNPPTSWPGPYTADLACSDETPIPGLAGRGWIAGTVGKDGSARFSGGLPDGTRWSSTQPLAIGGTVPIFAPLYASKGVLFGGVALTGSPVTLDSTLNWFRPANLPGTRFTQGWPDGIKLTLSGGAWIPFTPKLTWPLPGLAATGGSAHLWVNGGGLSKALDWPVTFNLATDLATVAPNPPGVTAIFRATAATGVFTGSFKTSPTATAIGFSGVMITGKDRARGYFVTPTGGGPVTLLPQ